MYKWIKVLYVNCNTNYNSTENNYRLQESWRQEANYISLRITQSESDICFWKILYKYVSFKFIVKLTQKMQLDTITTNNKSVRLHFPMPVGLLKKIYIKIESSFFVCLPIQTLLNKYVLVQNNQLNFIWAQLKKLHIHNQGA